LIFKYTYLKEELFAEVLLVVVAGDEGLDAVPVQRVDPEESAAPAQEHR
jgi:hypothetical protein